MGLEEQSKTIQDVNYTVTQFGAKKGRQVMVILSRVLGPALGGAATAQGAEASIAAAFERGSAALTEQDFDRICDAFAECTKYQTPGAAIALPLGPQFDQHFKGRYSAMLQWLVFAVQVNFADFLDGIGDLGSLVQKKPNGQSSDAEQAPTK